MKLKDYTQGFTLIELLIVVAIIAILAAIAVPNFLEAQTRAKISRVKNDLRVIDTGLTTYRLDHNNYPLMNASNTAMLQDSKAGQPQQDKTLERLTTPISYLSGRATFYDPFPAREAWRIVGATASDVFDTEDEIRAGKEYFYAARGVKSGGTNQEHLQWGDAGAKVQWTFIHSSGPQLRKFYFGTEVNGMWANDTPAVRNQVVDKLPYDSTNGTVSRGIIGRVVGEPSGRGSVFGKVMQSLPQ